jgi:hypothetical protein
MYVNVSRLELHKLLKVRTFGFDRSPNGDFIFDVWHYRIRVNFRFPEGRKP